MKFIDTIITLVAVVSLAVSAYFVGHSLSSEHPGPTWIVAAVLLGFGLLMGWFAARRMRRYPPPSSHSGAH